MNFKIINAFSRYADRPSVNAVPLILPVRKSLSLYPRQDKVYNFLTGVPYGVLICPTGWGKSVVLKILASFHLLDPHRKIIILVPRTDISPGFSESAQANLPTGEKVEYGSSYDYCGKKTQQKVNKVRHFLKSPAGKTEKSRVLITTHGCFVAACDSIKNWGAYFGNTTVIADEAHFICDGGHPLLRNEIGKIFDRLLDLGENICKVYFSTATFGRGDGLPIISEANWFKFQKIEVPFDEYWIDLKYLKQFSYRYVVYKNGDPFEGLATILKPKKPTLFFCPPKGNRFLGLHSKSQFIKKVLDTIKQVIPEAKMWTEGITDNNVIVDLTIPKNKLAKIKYIKKYPERVVAILAVGMFKLGADCPPLQRIVDFVPAVTSTPERVQKFGRGTRDYPGKVDLEYYAFLPQLVDKDDGEHRAFCNDYFLHLILTLIDSNYYAPLTEWKIPRKSKKGGSKAANALSALPESEQATILGAVKNALIMLTSKNENPTEEEFIGTIRTTVESQGHDEDVADQIAALLKRLARLNLIHNDSIDFSAAMYYEVSPAQVLECLKMFAAEACSLPTFQKMREFISRRKDFVSYEDLKATIHKMRKNSQPLNSGDEYRIWRQSGCNYSAVLEWRNQRA